MVNNAKLVKAGEVVLTSAVDITGEGWQDVTFNQFGQRAVTGLATMAATDIISKQFKNKPDLGIDQKANYGIDGVEVEGRIHAGSLKEFKSLITQLSKPGSELTVQELKQLEKLTEQFGGKMRYDLNPIRGKIRNPHVQIEGLGSSIESRHIWLGKWVKLKK